MLVGRAALPVAHVLCFAHSQIWRLVTCFLFMGKLSLSFVIRVLWVIQYGVPLEKQASGCAKGPYTGFSNFNDICMGPGHSALTTPLQADTRRLICIGCSRPNTRRGLAHALLIPLTGLHIGCAVQIYQFEPADYMFMVLFNGVLCLLASPAFGFVSAGAT